MCSEALFHKDGAYDDRRFGMPITPNISWHHGKVTAEHRKRYFRHYPATIWLTGLSGAGKSTIAYELEKMLVDEGHPG